MVLPFVLVIETLRIILNIHVPKCPVVCLLGDWVDDIQSDITQRISALAFLSVKRTILMNWKVQKPDCFDMNWLRDFRELVSMARASSALIEFDGGLEGHGI